MEAAQEIWLLAIAPHDALPAMTRRERCAAPKAVIVRQSMKQLLLSAALVPRPGCKACRFRRSRRDKTEGVCMSCQAPECSPAVCPFPGAYHVRIERVARVDHDSASSSSSVTGHRSEIGSGGTPSLISGMARRALA